MAASAAACATNVAPPTAQAPERLVLEEYFKGKTTAWGVFQDRRGTLIRQFKVDIDGTWEGNVLTLDERFTYADGAKEQRIWTIRKTGPNTYEGTAGDVVGVAKGLVQGNQLSWIYDVELNIDGRKVVVTFDDRMWLQPDGILINRAKVKKFGIVFGEATIVFQSPNK
ncbi:MAG: DUF3833 domain-containing protein [Hyphomonadaceae bacterium]|nr:DUF3833 domain-containing protein [Hyphomonadaceae bacterium]